MNVKLTVVKGKPQGKILTFGPGEFFFGRGEECQVRFNSEWVSRQHCVLRVTDQEVCLHDLGSRNGTLVNGTLISDAYPLAEGDQIQLGPILFEVAFQPPPSPVLPAAPPLDTIRTAEDDGTPEEIPLDITATHPSMRQDPPAPDSASQ